MNIVTDIQTKAEDLEDTYPLSPLQHGMLMHSLLEPGSGIDVEQLIFELCETLDLPKLQQATKCLTDRHPILRTSFRWENLEAPRQEVHRLIKLPFEQHDWRSIPEGEHNRRFAEFLKADRRRGFDLAHPSLWRLTIVRYDATKWRLIWTQHHSILDGRAFALLLWELFTFYDALIRGEKITLPMPRPYRDYISWYTAQSFGKAESFWRSTLRHFSAPTPLPAYHSAISDGESGTAQGSYEVRLSPETTTALRTLTQGTQITLNTIIHGAWAVLLDRCSGQADVIFGVVRTTRRSSIAGAEAMIGLLLNTLPFRTLVKREMPLLAWLKEVRLQWLAMRDFEHTPLANVQVWSEVPPGMPLFQSAVRFENRHWDLLSRTLGSSWSDVEFVFFCKPLKQTMQLTWQRMTETSCV